MATITLRLSTKIETVSQKAEILIRFRHGTIDVYAKSRVWIKSKFWSKGKIVVPNVRIVTNEIQEVREANDKLSEITNLISTNFINADKSIINKEWILNIVDSYHNPEKYSNRNLLEVVFFDAFAEFITHGNFSLNRLQSYNVLRRILRRFEIYKGVKLGLETFSLSTARDLDEYLRKEHQIAKESIYADIVKEVAGSQKSLRPRGNNAISENFRQLRAFFNWCVNRDYITNSPLRGFETKTTSYGTPYYITINERNALYAYDISAKPLLETQRDIFVFQCLIGCRVGDLLAMKKSNVINGAVEYIATKTKEDKAQVIRVPLNSIALEILAKYKDMESDRLLPFVSSQKYNFAIKEFFTLAGLIRSVTVLNSLTEVQEQRPLNEIASSHLARRTFIGNLYKQVKDPNLVSSLSGHKEGSKAFARYREIDEDMKRDLVKLLE